MDGVASRSAMSHAASIWHIHVPILEILPGDSTKHRPIKHLARIEDTSLTDADVIYVTYADGN